MTTIHERSVIENSVSFPSSEKNIFVPQQLIEANELLTSINRRLEDCALEWQAKISRKQWKIFNSKAIAGSLSEHSLFSRTYFTEKNLDEAFQHLLSCNKIFSEHLKDFIDLLQDQLSVPIIKQACDVQNQSYNTSETGKVFHNTYTEEAQFSSLSHHCLSVDTNIPDYINNLLSVQNSFTNVVKAKVNFDTKFLGFEAVLHKATSTKNNTICHCKYCSNIMTTTNAKSSKKKSLNHRSRTIRKRKYLTRSAKTLFRKRNTEGPPKLIRDVAGDESPFKTCASIC